MLWIIGRMQVAHVEAGNDWFLWSAQDSVVRFLDALVADDVDLAQTMLAPAVTFANVSLRTLRGRARVMRMVERMAKSTVRYDIAVHHVSAAGAMVLVERTDSMSWRGLRISFWVCSHFEVRDRRIVVWRDYFDWLDVARSIVAAVFRGPRRAE